MAIINSTIYGSGGQPSDGLYKIATVQPSDWVEERNMYRKLPRTSYTYTKQDDEVVYRLGLTSTGYKGSINTDISFHVNGNNVSINDTYTWWGSANGWRIVFYNPKSHTFRSVDRLGNADSYDASTSHTWYRYSINIDGVGDIAKGIILPPSDCVMLVSNETAKTGVQTLILLRTSSRPTSPVDVYALADYS